MVIICPLRKWLIGLPINMMIICVSLTVLIAC